MSAIDTDQYGYRVTAITEVGETTVRGFVTEAEATEFAAKLADETCAYIVVEMDLIYD